MSLIDKIIYQQVELALLEDVGPGDVTTLACIDAKRVRAEITAKSDGVLAGLTVAAAVFKKSDKGVEFHALKKDGDSFRKGDMIASLGGDGGAILTAERTALNFLGHLSGIATLTAKFVEKVKGTKAKILDTRKTIPGLRYLEKYAVTCGGGVNHRFGLYDMALIKDNHIVAGGSITEAVNRMKIFLTSDEFGKRFSASPMEVEIEVEVENDNQLREAVACGIKRLLLDNQSVERLAGLVKTARGLSEGLLLEASGNITLNNVKQVAETGVDYISIGALTHSAPSSDFSLEIIS
jgi:nicotinate-nucleotide pyrophosphorylase (carboxylating)